MTLSSWGNYPKVSSTTHSFVGNNDLKSIVTDHMDLIPYGNGRSYGDSALGNNIITVRSHNLFLDFDESSGLLHVQSGVLLSEILDAFIPRGWFLKVTPGTRLITVGGAIASDVHGKNHHLEGCFSECTAMLSLMLPNGDIAECSKHDNSELFRATCGGMGLTGVILDAKISLRRINSTKISQTTIKTANLKETFNAFESNDSKHCSSAWIDCLAKGSALGRGLLITGDFDDDGSLDYESVPKLSIPFNFPSFILNKFSVKCFNHLYYARVKQPISTEVVDIDSFFYPLDSIEHWNRIYGAAGFAQYQFVLPKATSYDGLEEALNSISRAGLGSFLAVLKLCGRANENYLSFPMEGYSLALDFKIQKGIFNFFDELDQIVLKYGGRLYLAKDSRVTKAVFEQGYPRIGKFRDLREKYEMTNKFNSMQSRRVEI